MQDHEVQVALKTAEKALEDAITDQEQAESRFYRNSAEIVHDIKNPLSAMMACFAMIRRQGVNKTHVEMSHQHFQTIEVAATRMLNICNMLLENYIDKKDQPVEVPVVNVSNMAREVHALFSAQAEEREIQFKASISQNMLGIKGQPEDLNRVLVNLVSNALKFTPRGGAVEIKTEVDPNKSADVIVVRDSGIGMTKMQIRQIEDSHLSRQSPHGDKGTGLGLAIVNRIVRNLGGDMEIVSSHNHGTRIQIHFPHQCLEPTTTDNE